MRLFEIGQQYKELQDLLENDCEFNDVTGEVMDNTEVIKQLFEDLDKHFGNKLDSCAYILTELDVSSNALKDEAKRLTSRAKVLENNAMKLKELMLETLKNSESKIKTDKFTFSLRNSEAVEIGNNFDMMGKYAVAKTTYAPDKKLIKEALKSGEEIVGAEIVKNTSLVIK